MKAHILKVLCGSRQELFDYVMNWMARLFSLEPPTHSPVVASMSEAPFDLDALSELLDRAALARRLSMTTTDEQAAVTLGRLAEELDVQIGFLAKELVRGDW
jgi:hypothetical protein